jgi:hypothetical protein
MKPNLTLFLQIAGLLYIGLVWAGLTMPRVVGLRRHISGLPPFVQRLFWVYYTFIGFTLVSFGVITFAFAETLAAGGPLARAVCLFLAGFWTIRLIAASFIFDVRPYLTNTLLRIGYQATNIVFAYLPIVYVWAAWKGGVK